MFKLNKLRYRCRKLSHIKVVWSLKKKKQTSISLLVRQKNHPIESSHPVNEVFSVWQHHQNRILWLFLYSLLSQCLCNEGFGASIRRGECGKAAEQKQLYQLSNIAFSPGHRGCSRSFCGLCRHKLISNYMQHTQRNEIAIWCCVTKPCCCADAILYVLSCWACLKACK